MVISPVQWLGISFIAFPHRLVLIWRNLTTMKTDAHLYHQKSRGYRQHFPLV